MKINKIKIISIALLLAAFLFVIYGTKKVYNDFFWSASSSNVSKWGASTTPLQSEEKVKSELDRMLSIQRRNYKDLVNYPTIPIPGLRGAWSLKKDKVAFGVDWVPQGLAISENNLFISAYDKKHQLNSIVYVINKKSGKYLKTIILDTKAHVGGLAYDVKYKRLWIATDTSKNARLTVLSQKNIDTYQPSLMKKSILSDKTFDIQWWTNVSSLSISDNVLSLAYYDSKEKGGIISVTLNSSGYLENRQINHAIELKKTNNNMITIIDKNKVLNGSKIMNGKERMQGISFSEDLLFISQSNGLAASKVGIYRYKRIEKTGSFEFGKLEKSDEVSIPTGVEQIAVDPYSSKVYIVFESGARPYRADTFEIMDRVISLNFK
ncbi:hypothetical protein EFE32_07040 [Lactococcus lactis subsp. lactis]|uniref:hypothetical protein n=1 Tax=Lactococcus lactis TaxID=1358 RepID=UPI00223AFC2F|nr:hypothetical protein [Lactococcus lactis]MCT0016598.1 hypothetical protein [Lactococcus lactis subsp. lactis]